MGRRFAHQCVKSIRANRFATITLFLKHLPRFARIASSLRFSHSSSRDSGPTRELRIDSRESAHSGSFDAAFLGNPPKTKRVQEVGQERVQNVLGVPEQMCSECVLQRCQPQSAPADSGVAPAQNTLSGGSQEGGLQKSGRRVVLADVSGPQNRRHRPKGVLPQRCFDASLTHFRRIFERILERSSFPNKTRPMLAHFCRISDAFLLLPTPFPRTPFGTIPKPERGHKNRNEGANTGCPWTPRTGTRVHKKQNDGTKSRNEGTFSKTALLFPLDSQRTSAQ